MSIPASAAAGAFPDEVDRGGVSSDEQVLRAVLPDARKIAERAFKIPAQDVDDVLQQAAVDFLVHARRGALATAGLMIVITRRRCLDFWRSRYRSRREVAIDELRDDESPCVEDRDLPGAEAAADGARLARTWPSLSDNCRHVLARRFWQNQRTADLAERMGYKRETLKRMISRCLGRLRRSLGVAA
ncbi:MAG TPA: sigma-70 family RNA polymerase sigma factor [Thermoanaerobaculia bacterium]|nr:sigma-70 family RNA polymerase sigma factor [Thermoanaerobaculia bacterium]